MKILSEIKKNKDTIMFYFWAGIGFWTAEMVLGELYMFIKEMGEF